MPELRRGAGSWPAWLALGLLLSAPLPGRPDAALGAAQDYHLEISKEGRNLQVKNGDIVVRQYRISSGRGGPGNKKHRGDDVTPIGVYRVIKLKEKSRFHYFMQINYPNIMDAWHGYRDGVISSRQLDTIIKAHRRRSAPPQNTPLGGFLGIHGIGATTERKLAIHNSGDWTNGCIALTNQEVNELRQYVKIGTPIVIRD